MQHMNTHINRETVIIAISIVILLIGLGYLRTQQREPEFAEGTTMQTDALDSEANQIDMTQLSQTQLSPVEQEPSQAHGTLTRQGILLASDNPTRGNLMLKTQTSTFYFRTSRDYSSLMGKSVTATGNGTTEQFSLTNITENK